MVWPAYLRFCDYSGRNGLVCWSLTSLCHSNGHIETMPAREINPFTALTRIRFQFLRTQWSTSNHQRVDTTTPLTAQPSGLALVGMYYVYAMISYVSATVMLQFSTIFPAGITLSLVSVMHLWDTLGCGVFSCHSNLVWPVRWVSGRAL